MKKVLSILYLLVTISLVCFGTAWCSDEEPAIETEEVGKAENVDSQSGARIEVQEEEYDFGTLREGEVNSVSHTFHFKNVGTEDLLIKKIRPTCGCTSAVASATKVVPGAEATLTASLNAKGRSGSQGISVRVETNDPSKPQQLFKVKGLILSPWKVVPAIVDLRDIGKGETKDKLIHMSSQFYEGDAIQKITAVKSDNPAVRGVTEEFEQPKEPVKGAKYYECERPLRVFVTAGDKLGTESARLLVATDDPKNPTIAINVRWTVEGDLVLSRKRVGVRKMGGNSTPALINLSSRGGKPFEVVSVEVKATRGDPNAVEVSPVEPTKPDSKTYEIKVSPNASGGQKMIVHIGDIVITTNHPEEKVVTVSYTATVRD